jgi:asparagine synthase (glutamine-hydrolysing)
MADTIIARGVAETPRLDTISYYDDREPNWNERPYFTKVEEKRGRTGYHIDVGSQEPFKVEFDSDRFAATPGANGRPDEASRQFAACVTSLKNRVVLSGIGGDEVTDGVPTPGPELEDLLARGQFQRFAHRMKVWALNKRRLCSLKSLGRFSLPLSSVSQRTSVPRRGSIRPSSSGIA